MLQNLGSDYLPILSIPLSPVFRPNERPPSFNFQKARRDGFASYFDSHCPSAEEYSSDSLSSAAALFTSLALNAAKSSIPFGRIKRPPLKPGGLLRWNKRLVKDARLLLPLTEVLKIARFTSPLLDAPRQSSPWPRHSLQTTCNSLSPRSNPKSVLSLLRSIAGSPSSSSSSPNFPNCSSPRELASIYAAYLRSHFSVSQPEATSLSSAKSRALWSLTRPFALLSLPRNFLRLPPTFPHPLPLPQTKLPILC